MLMSNHDDHKHVFARWRKSEVSEIFIGLDFWLEQ